MRGREPNHIPKKVGPYRIEQVLGAGGMATVYRAYDKRLGRHVALKRLLPQTMGEEEDVRQRFRREARAAAGLNHPVIVQIFDILDVDDTDWIVMELVEGSTLRQLAEAGSLFFGELVRLAHQVCDGLADAHGHGIVHRDLKAENIMVTPAGRAKILDFGLAKWFDSSQDNEAPNAESLSRHGTVVGTCRAMSPEQAMGHEVSQASDLFALGTLLYETSTGRSPFIGKNDVETMARVCSLAHTPAKEVNPELPVSFSDLLDHLLQKAPEARPANVQEVILALHAVSEEKMPLAALPPFAASYGNGGKAPRSPDAARSPEAALPGPELGVSGPHAGGGAIWNASQEVDAVTPASIAAEEVTAAERPAAELKATRVPDDEDILDQSWPVAMAREAARTTRTYLFEHNAWRLLWLIPLAMILVFVAVRYLGRTVLPAVEPRPAVAVMGFKNLGSVKNDWISTALAEMISSQLAGNTALRLIPGENVTRTKVELGLVATSTLAVDTLDGLRDHLAADYVVLGSYLAQEVDAESERIQLLVQMQDTRDGAVVASFSKAGSVLSLLDFSSEVAVLIHQKLGTATLAPTDKALLLETDPEAVRLYAEGLVRLRSRDAAVARTLLEEAVRIEPDYAAGHAALGRAWFALGEMEKARASAGRAVKLSDGHHREEFLAIQAFYYEMADDWPSAVKTYQVLWGFLPDNVDYGLQLIHALHRVGRLRDALATAAELRALPAGTDPRIDLLAAEIEWDLEDMDAYMKSVRRATTRANELGSDALAGEADLLYGRGLVRLGRPDEARNAYESSHQRFLAAGDRRKMEEAAAALKELIAGQQPTNE